MHHETKNATPRLELSIHCQFRNFSSSLLYAIASMMFSRQVAQRLIQQNGWCPNPSRFVICRSTRFLSAGTSESTPPRRRGNLLIGLGWALLGLLAVDQALQYKQEQEAKEHRQFLYQMQAEANEENEAQWDASLPALFKCKICHTEVSLDGTKMLRNIGVGDVVEVLDVDIGPNQAYYLCRNPASDRPGSIGWYPKQYLERMD
jgi:hypothetical protein